MATIDYTSINPQQFPHDSFCVQSLNSNVMLVGNDCQFLSPPAVWDQHAIIKCREQRGTKVETLNHCDIHSHKKTSPDKVVIRADNADKQDTNPDKVGRRGHG